MRPRGGSWSRFEKLGQNISKVYFKQKRPAMRSEAGSSWVVCFYAPLTRQKSRLQNSCSDPRDEVDEATSGLQSLWLWYFSSWLKLSVSSESSNYTHITCWKLQELISNFFSNWQSYWQVLFASFIKYLQKNVTNWRYFFTPESYM